LEEVQLSQRLTDGVEAGLRQLSTDCLRVYRYSFVAFNLAESVSLCIILDDLADVIQLYNWLNFLRSEQFDSLLLM